MQIALGTAVALALVMQDEMSTGGALDCERLEAEHQGSEESLSLFEIWRSLVQKERVVLSAFHSAERSYLVLSRGPGYPPTTPLEKRRWEILRRTLTGEPQKAIAQDLGVAISTVAFACSSALRALGLEHSASRAPISLIHAAHAASGLTLEPARLSRGRLPHLEYWVVSVARPDRSLPSLTPAESRVVRMVVEGRTRREIAAARRASTRTVANQLSSAFRKLHASGRSELLARLVEPRA